MDMAYDSIIGYCMIVVSNSLSSFTSHMDLRIVINPVSNCTSIPSSPTSVTVPVEPFTTHCDENSLVIHMTDEPIFNDNDSFTFECLKKDSIFEAIQIAVA